ncbi:MAG: hypothetical protein JSV68_14270 [Anaerolineaceae bacterium]|nr:MAG: hypothetical protein JSV68_14270 [Anaerolineaceae bacterium]
MGIFGFEYYRVNSGVRVGVILGLVVGLVLLVGCGSGEADAEVTAEATATEAALAAAPATWTPEPTETVAPTNTAVPTNTREQPTETPEPTATNTPKPTATDTPEPTATELPPTETPLPLPTSPPAAPPTLPPEPVLGVNLIPNGSFEEGHYNQDGIPELQLPNRWRLEWDEGPTGVGNASWDNYVRPEVRVLSTAFLPPEEHPLYIYNGQHTLKAFKGSGAVSLRLLTDVTLEPGTYVIEAKMFADIVQDFENNQKVWASDPSSAEFHFIVGDGGTVWTWQNFGQINVHNWTFTVDELKTMTVGIALRGRYALSNNGWFIDDLSLRRIE